MGAIPGNAADFPADERGFHTFIEQAVPVHGGNQLPLFAIALGIKMVDRLTGKPLHLDISDQPMKRASPPTQLNRAGSFGQ